MAREKTVFVVSRVNWRPTNGGNWWLAPGTARLASFTTADEAETERARREANAQRRVNPFRCDRLFAELTTLPAPIFRDWVRDAGLTPPPETAEDARDAWAAWWDTERPGMSAEQLAKLWEGLNRVRFFRVDERPNAPAGYAVMSCIWEDHSSGSFLHNEGGKVEAVYLDRARAEAAAREYASSPGRDRDWHPTGADLFDPETYWRMAMVGGPFDCIEIELDEGASAARKLHLVVRRTWNGPTGHLWLNAEERSPVCGFATKKAAEAARRELEAGFRTEWDVWPLFAGHWDWAGQTDQFEKTRAAAVRRGLIAEDAAAQWWWSLASPPTAEQRAALWAAAPDNRAHEVVEAQLVK